MLKEEILSPDVAEFQIRQYLVNRIAAPPQVPSSPQEWTSEAARLRHHLLQDIAFHGWPREWVEAEPKFEEVGVIETGAGTVYGNCATRLFPVSNPPRSFTSRNT